MLTCVIVAVSFAIFAVGQTSTASSRQREAVAASGPAAAAVAAPHAAGHESSVHRTIDDVAGALTSPFSGVVAQSSGEWAVRGVKLLLALLVYGFGLGYLARSLRVRV